MTLNPTNPGVSVELNTSFLSSAKAGDVLRIEGRQACLLRLLLLLPCHTAM